MRERAELGFGLENTAVQLAARDVYWAGEAARMVEANGAKIIDITNPRETNLFREHLYHMVHPKTTSRIIDEFVAEVEATHHEKETAAV